MDTVELKRWLASVSRLTPAQKAELLRALSAREALLAHIRAIHAEFTRV